MFDGASFQNGSTDLAVLFFLVLIISRTSFVWKKIFGKFTGNIGNFRKFGWYFCMKISIKKEILHTDRICSDLKHRLYIITVIKKKNENARSHSSHINISAQPKPLGLGT